ncbi:potassium/proton antiporter [Virgibacillus kimchii]
MSEGIFVMDYFPLLLGLLLVIGVLTTKFSSQLGLPALVLYILVGMIIGSDGLGLIYFDDYELARLIGMIALVIILFDGGFHTKWSVIKPVITPSILLATLGVLLTAVITGLGAILVLGVGWMEGMLFGAIVGSTDAAAVFAVLKGKSIQPKVKATLEAESGSNDPMAMILMITFIEFIISDQGSLLSFAGSFLWQMIIGLIMGFTFGKLAVYSINKINLDSGGLYPVFALAIAILAYTITDLIGASGLLAVYVAGVLVGNSELAYHHSILRFNEGFTWIAQILMFTILGLLVFPTQLFTMDIILKALLISFILIVIARPAAVFLTTIKLGYTLKEKVFLSWAGLKGAVPIVLATFPLAAGLENSQLFFNVIFFIVLISTLLQGSTISFLAKKLGLTGPEETTPIHSLELISIGKANAEMIEYKVEEDDEITGKSLNDIEFPENVLVNAVIRNDKLITPSGDTVLNSGDILFILTSRKRKKDLRKLLEKKQETERAESPEGED